jgi:endonuclease/exonuclease/phosphatase family metal-dependent hydrolase
VDRLDEDPTGNLIASRWPLKGLPPLVTPKPERFLSAVVETPQGPLELHNAHIPDGSSNELGKSQGFVDLYASLAYRTQMPRILCGDFNSPELERKDGTVEYWKDAYAGLQFVAERSVLSALARTGLPDTFRRKHGYGVEAFSWFAQRTGQGRRYDHMFTSRSLRIAECAYQTTWREDGLSDHAAIEATLDWPPPRKPVGKPLRIRSALARRTGKTLKSQRGRDHRILEVGPETVLVATRTHPEGTAVSIEWIEAAARRLQVDGRVEVTPSRLGTSFASIGAILASVSKTHWRGRRPPQLHRN